MADLIIRDLTVRYRSTKDRKLIITAIDELSVVFKANTFNVIVGASGCGKTTLLRSIIGSLEMDGDMHYGEQKFSQLATQDRHVSYVSQNYVLYPRMTIFDNIAFPLRNIKASRAEIITKVEDISYKLGIEYCLTRKPKHLSGGQQQRVALARALVKKSNIYLFDEPLSNLDAQERVKQRQLIKDVIETNNAIAIYVTHDFDEALSLADHLFVMDEGKIVLDGTPEEIYNSNNEIVNAYKNDFWKRKD